MSQSEIFPKEVSQPNTTIQTNGDLLSGLTANQGAVHGTNVALANSRSVRLLGTATTTMQFPNVYGQPQPPQTFQTNVLAEFSDPVIAGGLRESNPFNLFIAPADNQSLASPGTISIWSAAAYSFNRGTSLTQFWNMSMTDTNRFQGTLVDNRVAESQAINLINSPYEVAPGYVIGAFPLAIAQGTQIAGVIGNNQINIQIAGNTTDIAHPFRTEIVLTSVV